MTYLSQLSNSGNDLTFKRKKEYIRYNFGRLIDDKLKFKNCTVLEIGPGLGEFVSYCNDQGTESMDVIDYEKEVLDYVSKKFKVKNKFISADVFPIKEKLGTYDIIMMTQVLEHIPVEKHITYLQTLYSHLNVGGVIIITVPNIGNPLAIYERYYDYTHETAFTDHSLIQLADFAHLKNSKMRVQGFYIPTYDLLNIIRSGLQFILHGLFKLLFMANGGVYPHVLTTNITLVIEKSGK
ncbi:class I SAM-dependent methyltransferase [Candidatus Roizmanbacteria bacterium]|nr:class I SAM-dependent methyltransferase [Candidatus Roizmanbacteria bacterium]